MSGLRAAARAKPIVVMKAGRHRAGSKAAVTHSGALVGNDAVFDAALARAGVVRVTRFADFFAAAQILAAGPRVGGDRLTVISNGGGPAVMAVDHLAQLGREPAALDPSTLERLDGALPPTWSHANPVDLIGDAPPERYRAALEACLDDPGTDAILAILTPQAMTAPTGAAEAVIGLAAQRAGAAKPIITCWMGEASVVDARERFRDSGIASYRTPEAAVQAFHVLATHRANQALLLQVPEPLGPGREPDRDGARAIVESVLSSGRTTLTELESKALLGAFGIPMTPCIPARDEHEALLVAEEIGFPVVLKVNAPVLTHKSDVGGVRLDLRDVHALRQAYRELTETVARTRPDLHVDGVFVQPFTAPAAGREVMAGVAHDEVFGPVVCFGAGGTEVEVHADRGVALPPLDRSMARDLVASTRVSRALDAFRGRPAIDAAALEDVIVRLSDLVCAIPELRELDINPLVVHPGGAIAVDARAVIARRPALEPRYAHMAIHPYPAQWVEHWTHPDGTRVTVRPIRPEDATIEASFVRSLSARSRHFRFMSTLRELSPAMLARFTQIDYDREMAFIATVGDDEGGIRQIGVSRYIINPDGESCEFAIVVADDWQGKGLATRLLGALLRAAEARQLSRIEGDVLADNMPMLDLMHRLGFEIRASPEDPTIRQVSRRI